MTSSRLSAGGLIDRQTPLTFSWNGIRSKGFKGDTLASALLANGHSIIGRSFKYHRPRGVMSAGVEEAGALVTIGEGSRTDPNVAATSQELFDGLVARGQNAWPSVRWDAGSILGLFGRFFSAGFYYKTFMGLPPFESGKGTRIWMLYEHLIRSSAGMGKIERLPDADRYEQAHLHCDVVVVGGGIAGINAALAADAAGLEVVLVEQDFRLGGDLLSQGKTIAASATSLLAELEARRVRIMTRTTAFGLYENCVLGLLEKLSPGSSEKVRQRLWTLKAERVILATGAIERSIAFENNDRPGVMNASAGRTYANRFGVLPGKSLVVATTNSTAYQTAFDLAAVGAEVRILDSRQGGDPAFLEQARSLNIEVHTSSAPFNVLGKNGVTGLDVGAREDGSWVKKASFSCDGILVSGGWSPVIHLQSHLGPRPAWCDNDQCFLPLTDAPGMIVAGSAAGYWSSEECAASGLAAGEQVAFELGKRVRGKALPTRTPMSTSPDALYLVKGEKTGKKSFVDFLNDVAVADVRLAHQEGFISVEHLKRYTTLGMGSDQGKMGNVIGLATMADLLGKGIPDVGVTRFRPPYTSITLGALAGEIVDGHFKPLRRTPMHDWNLSKGSVMADAGLWHRPWYYPNAGETIQSAYIREATTIRRTVGICDVSSLGKIAVQGPDSATFLDRVYVNSVEKLKVGKTRYCVMLRDDGIVLDDGTAWRESDTDFFVTTTTTNAARVLTFFEELLQVRWPDLRVHVTSVTDQWGGFSVAGPRSRETLQCCLADPEHISNEALPFMGFVETRLKSGVPCRIARISFSGELAYECYVPADYGGHLAEVLSKEVTARDGCCYGLEALGTLRIEKGHVTGAELDGRTTLEDAGLGGMASKKKPFIGSSLKERPELKRADRPKLVGIFPVDDGATFNAGSILCREGSVSGFGEGWITAATYSPALGHWIGLGYISGGYTSWEGHDAVAADPIRNAATKVKIVSPHMFDPSGERMNG